MAEGRDGRPVENGKPSEKSDGSRDPARQERDRQIATQFREFTQSERLNDKRLNPAAKQVAAMDAAIDRKYGRATPEAARMKTAAREAVAQTLERGNQVRAPRVRDVEQQRETTRALHRDAADKNAKDLER